MGVCFSAIVIPNTNIIATEPHVLHAFIPKEVQACIAK